jgi:hypothetical protein
VSAETTLRHLVAAWAPVLDACRRYRDDRSEANGDAVVAAYEAVRPSILALEKANRRADLQEIETFSRKSVDPYAERRITES